MVYGHKTFTSNTGAVFVAHKQNAYLDRQRLWVRIPPGAGLFLFSLSLSQVPQGGAALLIYQK